MSDPTVVLVTQENGIPSGMVRVAAGGLCLRDD